MTTAAPEEIGNYVAFAADLEQQIEEADRKLKELKKRQRKLLEEDLPLAMDELGFTEIDTDQFKIKVGMEHYVSVPASKKKQVADYAEELGLEDLVSQEIKQSFAKDEQDMFEAAVALLNEHQQLYTVSQSLNSGSWKKACKELAATGANVDWDRACIMRVRQATIKRK